MRFRIYMQIFWFACRKYCFRQMAGELGTGMGLGRWYSGGFSASFRCGCQEKRGRSRGHGIGRRNCIELTNGRHHHHHHELKWAQPQNWIGIRPGYMFFFSNPPNYKLLFIEGWVIRNRKIKGIMYTLNNFQNNEINLIIVWQTSLTFFTYLASFATPCTINIYISFSKNS